MTHMLLGSNGLIISLRRKHAVGHRQALALYTVLVLGMEGLENANYFPQSEVIPKGMCHTKLYIVGIATLTTSINWGIVIRVACQPLS